MENLNHVGTIFQKKGLQKRQASHIMKPCYFLVLIRYLLKG